MGRAVALAMKDLKLLLRDRAGFFFTFFFPLIYCIFFGAIFGSGGGDSVRSAISVAVVDEDGTEGSRRFIEVLSAAEELDVVMASRDDAADQVRRGKRTAYIVLPRGFGDRLDNPFRGGMPQLETGIDPTRQAEAGMLVGILTKYTYQSIQSTFADKDRMRKFIANSLGSLQKDDTTDPIMTGALMLFLPALDVFFSTMPDDQSAFGGFGEIDIKKVDMKRTSTRAGRPRSSYDVSFPQGTIWGLLGCAAGFGISFVVERTRGTLMRLRTASISRTQIVAGKAMACFATTIALQIVLFSVGMLAFGVRPDSLVHLALAVCCASFAFVGIMMLLSVLGKTEQAAGGIGWAVLLLMAMVGGGMIPLFFMPPWLLAISNFSPVKWAIFAMEGAIFRGFSLQEMMLPCGVLLGIGVGCFAIGIRAFRWVQE